jgi:hypothetical protein
MLRPMGRLIDMVSAHRDLAIWVSCGSAVMFVGSLLLVPWLVARAPADYFVREHAPRKAGLLPIVLAALRNVLGAALLLIGLALLVLPGQGMLMVLVALSLMNFPGKRRLVRRIVQQNTVWRALGYFRERAEQPPFEHP